MKLEDQAKLSRAFTITEKVLENKPKLLVLHGKLCSAIAVKLLKRISDNRPLDSKWDYKLIVSFGNFIWETIAWCDEATVAFISEGGIFLLLDFIEVIFNFFSSFLYMI